MIQNQRYCSSGVVQRCHRHFPLELRVHGQGPRWRPSAGQTINGRFVPCQLLVRRCQLPAIQAQNPHHEAILASVLKRVALTSCLAAAPLTLLAGQAEASGLVRSPALAHLLEFSLSFATLYLLVKLITSVVEGSPSQHPHSSSSSPPLAPQHPPEGSMHLMSSYDEDGAPGITHTSSSTMRGWVDLAQKSRGNPDWLGIRNRALSSAATCSVAMAVKEAQPRIVSYARSMTRGGPGSRTLRPPAVDTNPLAALVYSALLELQAGREGGYAALSPAEQEEWAQRQVEAVAVKAALEQIEMLVEVVRESDEGQGASSS